MKRYLPVTVYRNDGPDCTLGGVSSHYGKTLVVPCEDGHITEEDLARDPDYIVMKVGEKGGARNFVPADATGWMMFGGNFVYTSDSRYSRLYGIHPMAVHDRAAALES